MAMNFSGILSRKAGRTVNMNANANASQVSNPEVAVAVMPELKPKRVSNRREAVAELKHRAEEVAPMAAPSQPAPAPQAVPKAEAAPKPAPKAKRTAKAKATATAKPMAEPAPQAEEKPRLTIMKYSEKCLALFGDTKPIKEQLKKLGGRYNPHLHPFGPESSVPGWVFPMKCRADLEKMVG